MTTKRGFSRALLLAVHIAATVSLLGADLVLLVLGVSGARGADPQTVYPAARLVGTWLAAPLAVVSLGTGFLQGLLTSWGLLRYWWVTIKLVITVALTGVLLLVLVPALVRVAELVTGPMADTLTDTQRMRLAVAPAVAAALLALNVALSTWKPGWRLQARRSD